ncbi:MAG: TRAP transporter large permease subunit [Pseudomonadota bacterium]
MIELIPVALFACVCVLLLIGFPVAFTLAGTALAFASFGVITGTFDPTLLNAIPSRLFGIMNNITLIAVPLFVLMGVLLEKSRIAEQLLNSMGQLFGRFPGGLSISVILVGTLLAASTGIVGATVITMGLISLPIMLRHHYSPELACGTICATGTLGQVIPPSIALILLGDTLSNAYQKAQLAQGVTNPNIMSVGDLFVGAIVPGLILVACYIAYVVVRVTISPSIAPPIVNHGAPVRLSEILKSLCPPLLLILLVLGSIVAGIATPTEAAALGSLGALILYALRERISASSLHEVAVNVLKINAMVFMILIGATVFSLVFRGFHGDELIQQYFTSVSDNKYTALFIIMLALFVLGFILDFIEIIFIVVPIVAPILLGLGFDPVWLGVVIAVNLQTSFLTPPFGFALFYLRGVTPPEINTSVLYRGVLPFILIQLCVLCLLVAFPNLVIGLRGT